MTTQNPAQTNFNMPLSASLLTRHALLLIASASVILLTGCSSMETPATADVAVSRAAVDNAAGAGAATLAPDELGSARRKLALANQALANKDYKTAQDMAMQAQADAKLAQSKANSTKATEASDALNEDIRVMREELNRAGQQPQPQPLPQVQAQ